MIWLPVANELSVLLIINNFVSVFLFVSVLFFDPNVHAPASIRIFHYLQVTNKVVIFSCFSNYCNSCLNEKEAFIKILTELNVQLLHMAAERADVKSSSQHGWPWHAKHSKININ